MILDEFGKPFRKESITTAAIEAIELEAFANSESEMHDQFDTFFSRVLGPDGKHLPPSQPIKILPSTFRIPMRITK